MTATQPKPTQRSHEESTVFRAKVTGRHAITLPAELCRRLGIEVGDSVELEIRGDTVELRPMEKPRLLTLEEMRGIMRPLFKDWQDIQQYIRELRDEWDEFEELEDALPNERAAD